MKKFEDQWISTQKLTPEQAFQILDSMREEAVTLGTLPSKDPMEGIEVDLRIAEILNSCSKTSSQKSEGR